MGAFFGPTTERNRAGEPSSPAFAGLRPKRRLRSWVIALVVGGFSACVTYVVGDEFLQARLPEALLGKWVIVEGEGKGTTIEFFRNGVMRRTTTLLTGTDVLEGEAEVEGDFLRLTVTLPGTGRSTTSRQFLFDLSGRQLVTGGMEGNITILRRAP